MRKAGYSLFELIILIAVLGVVCYFVVLNRGSLTSDTPRHKEMAAAEFIRVGLQNYATMSKKLNRFPVFPLKLDEARDGQVASNATPLFTKLFPKGIRSDWEKVRTNEYVYLPNAHGRITPANTYHYDPIQGTFLKGNRKSNAQTA